MKASFKTAAAVLTVSALAWSAVQASPITYYADRYVGDAHIVMSLTTDGTLGALYSHNFTEWNVRISTPNGTATMFRDLSMWFAVPNGANSYADSYNFGVEASAAELFIDLDSPMQAAFGIRPDNQGSYPNDNAFYAVETYGYAQLSGASRQYVNDGFSPVVQVSIPCSGRYVIASNIGTANNACDSAAPEGAVNVPEPSLLGLFGAGVASLGLARRHRRGDKRRSTPLQSNEGRAA